MQQSRIRKIIESDKRYLDALEAADKSGKMPKLNKVRKNFTVDEEVFDSFQDRCLKEGKPMSRVLEECMRKYGSG